MLKSILPAFFLSAVVLSACTSDEEAVCVTQPEITDPVSLTILHLEDSILQADRREKLVEILNENPVVAEIFLKRSQYPSDSVMIAVLNQRFSNPSIDTLAREVSRIFGEGSALESDLHTAYSNLRYYYPEFEVPEIQTVATGLEYDLYVSDSLVVIGLDYFLGPDAKYRPLGLYNYMLQRYIPEAIVPSIMLLYGISTDFNQSDLSDKTMLADMITYGKAFYFAKHMLPCTPDSVLISYTTEEITGTRENEEIIWAHFVENNLLFETNHEIKKKYLEERPKTFEIGEKAPGRIGRWLGWQIIREYMDRYPETTLPELMALDDPGMILEKSKYRP